MVDNGCDDLGLGSALADSIRSPASRKYITARTRAFTLTPPLMISTAWVVETIALPRPGGRTPSLTLPSTHQSRIFSRAFLSTLPFLEVSESSRSNTALRRLFDMPSVYSAAHSSIVTSGESVLRYGT